MASHAAALRALELQGRHLGMWKDRSPVTAEVSIADAIRQSAARRVAMGPPLAMCLVGADSA